MQTLEIVANVIREVFDIDELEVTPGTTAADVPGWDSFGHVSLIIAIEKKLGLRFTVAEITDLQNVGELIAVIERQSFGH